jgi:hypothetical protein
MAGLSAHPVPTWLHVEKSMRTVAISLASTSSGACDLAPGSAGATADERSRLSRPSVQEVKVSGRQQVDAEHAVDVRRQAL